MLKKLFITQPTIFKKFVVSLMVASLAITQASFAQAASPTPSATPKASPIASPKTTATSPSPSPTATANTTQKIRERIDKIVEQKRDQIQGAIEDLAGQRRGLVGEVQRISAESITIKNIKNEPIVLPLNSDLALVKKGKTIKVEEIAIGDWVVVIGNRSDENFVPKRLIVANSSLTPADRVITLGTVKSVSKTEVIVTSRSGQEDRPYSLIKSTSYQDSTGQALTVKALTKDLQVLIIGQENQGKIEAKVIRILSEVKNP
jgi:hypothetical protein